MVSVLPAVPDCKLLLSKYIWSFSACYHSGLPALKKPTYGLNPCKKYIIYITI